MSYIDMWRKTKKSTGTGLKTRGKSELFKKVLAKG